MCLWAGPISNVKRARAGAAAAGKVLLVFFSRAGENYFNGGRKVPKVGGCDVFTIRAVEPYSDRYDPTVERNVREQNDDARPGIIALPGYRERLDSA